MYLLQCREQNPGMEDFSGLTDSQFSSGSSDLNYSNSSSATVAAPFVLPSGIAAYAPFVLIVFAVAAISNIILMALIIKAKNVQNNTNIYLFSLGIAGLLKTVNLFALFVTVVARTWVLGAVFCSVSSAIHTATLFSVLTIHMFISRDRYKAVRDPFKWQPKTNWVYVYTAFAWSVPTGYSLWKLISQIRKPSKTEIGETTFVCFSATFFRTFDNPVSYTLTAVFLGIYYLAIVTVSAIAVGHYIMTFREIHIVETHRIRHSMLSSSVLKVNGRDRPLECTAEERTTKSLALIFSVQFVCTLVSNIMGSIRTMQSLLRRIPFTEFTPPAEFIFRLIINLLPAVNPALLILVNSRFRNRVKDLFKWELKPEEHRPKKWANTSIKLPENCSPNNKQICISIFIREKTSSGPTRPNSTLFEPIDIPRRPVIAQESKRQSVLTEVVSLKSLVISSA